jgi:hypothetical protein
MSPRVAWQMVGDEVIVLDVASGRAVGLNPVATFIWRNLEKMDSERLPSAIAEEFAVDESTASKDLQEFLDRFVREDYLQVDA